MDYIIKTNDLEAGYNNNTVFKNFNIEIPRGKITTFIGPNGSGKSTILKTISRLIIPSTGNILLNGESIHSIPTKLVAQKLALLPQGSTTPSEITVEDLVEYGRFPYKSRFSKITETDKEIIKWALESTNMINLKSKEVDELSGGQRQRAWISMALAQKTGIILLDEPTTFLDISYQLEILQLLRDLNTTQNSTIVMVLHDLNHAIMFSDYLVIIKDGKMKYFGTPIEVITKEILKEIFDVESEIINHPILNVPVFLPYSVKNQVIKEKTILRRKNE